MDDYEMNQKKNVERNKKFLEEFKEYLILNKLSDKTIRNHLSNVELYINYYLNYYEVSKMEDGCHGVGMFLGIGLLESVCGLQHLLLNQLHLV